jgi:multicomponent Na+:H+ antiporter subunit D
VFYIMHHIIVKANLFLVSGLVYRLRGSYELKELGGLYRDTPWVGILFLIPALSLAGLPPLSGFFAKFILIRAGLETGAWVAVGVALLVGLLTLYSMIKIWGEVFWKAAPAGEVASESVQRRSEPGRDLYFFYLPIAGLAVLTLIIGLSAQPIYVLAETAAGQLLDPAGYIEAVLGVRP